MNYSILKYVLIGKTMTIYYNKYISWINVDLILSLS